MVPMKFWKIFAFDLPPHFRKIIMQIFLETPRLRPCTKVQNLQYIMSPLPLELFRKIICFGTVTHPLERNIKSPSPLMSRSSMLAFVVIVQFWGQTTSSLMGCSSPSSSSTLASQSSCYSEQSNFNDKIFHLQTFSI